MRVVVALDSFKGSLGSRDAGEAVRAGVLAADPTAAVAVREIADGGEGTLAAVLAVREGREVAVDTVDALGRPISAGYGVIGDGAHRTAILEAARTIGLDGVGRVDATVPVRAGSHGVGLQLRHALAAGVDRVLVALGGSATTDGGTGLLAALGAVVTDERGAVAGPGANPLWHGAFLAAGSLPDLTGVELTVLADVRNPMVGPQGAAATFGPQKGATPAQVATLDERMRAWAAELERESGRGVADLPGAGAAGGIAGALLALGATLEPGFDRVAQEIGLADTLRGADLVFTGEGALDAQTGMGKAPAGVARMGRDAGAVVVGLGGRVDRPLTAAGFDAAVAIHSRARPLAEALDPDLTRAELRATAEELTRLVLAARRGRGEAGGPRGILGR